MDTLRERLRDILAVELQVEPARIVWSASLRTDLGMDSVAALNVLFAAEETFGFAGIDPTELADVQTVADVETLVRRHLEGIVAWAQTRQTNGFLEAINGLFQAAKRRARGFTRLSTIGTVIFLIAGKLDFQAINPHARQPT